MIAFDALPQLAVGNQSGNQGYACVMNAISWMQGDRKITDLPDCVWQPLAYLAQAANDSICNSEHAGHRVVGETTVESDASTILCYPVALLCPTCTHQMWMAGVRLIGTSSAELTFEQKEEIKTGWWKLISKWLREDGICYLVADTIDGLVYGSYAPQGLPHAMEACSSEHAHPASYVFVEEVAQQAVSVMAAVERHAVSGPDWGLLLVDAVRPVLTHNRDKVGERFSQVIDVFEEVAMFLATPPTPLDVKDAAQRAGLAMV